MIPIIINNRNLLTWPKAMVEKIKTFENVGDIFILDNGSDYPPLLEWYNTKPCEIIKIDNIGHEAPWKSGLVKKLNKNYVVTDGDLGLDDIPSDVLVVLEDKLNSNSYLGKVGLGLDWERITKNLPYYDHLQEYEKARWETSRVVNDIWIDVHIDTTFAYYNLDYYFIGGGSIKNPYVARHYAWELTEEERQSNTEFSYYIANASKSSSYKVFLGL